MNTKKILVAALLTGMIMALSLGTIIYLALIPRVSVSLLRSQIETDLPGGTSRARVEEWLLARRINWVDILQERRPVGLGGEIKGVYRLEFLSYTDIEFEFYFDEQNELVSFFIREETYGL